MQVQDKERWDWQWEAVSKIVNYQVGNHRLLVAGSGPLDMLLGRNFKDIDVFLPEEELPNFNLAQFISDMGMGPTEEPCLEVVSFSNDYGKGTLRYDIRGSMLGQPVWIQIISFKAEGEDISLVGDASHPSTNSYYFARRVLQSFPISTLFNYAIGDGDGNCIINTCTTDSYNGKLGLTSMYVFDASSTAFTKTVTKYEQYSPHFCIVNKEAKAGVRSPTHIVNRGLDSYIKYRDGIIKIASYRPHTIEGISLEREEIIRKRDTRNPLEETGERMSDMFTSHISGTGSIRPRPWGGLSPGGAAQELQWTRVEAPRVTPSPWFGDSVTTAESISTITTSLVQDGDSPTIRTPEPF